MPNQKNEFALIEQIKKIVTQRHHKADSQIHIGLGDDAAVVEAPNLPLLLCSDAMVENTHFRLNWSQPEEIGHKALASCLSDIAAMNGKPLYAVISLALRPGLTDDFVLRFYTGLQALATQTNTAIVGGDTVSSRNEIFVDVALLGCSAHPISRSGARAGDLVAVTGQLGSSQAALAALQAGIPRNEIPADLLRAHVQPQPRFDTLAQLSRPGLITSLIDISDGLASELHHVASASSCGFQINEFDLPIAPTAIALAIKLKQVSTDWAWSGGEDYQLLMTLDRAAWESYLESPSSTSTSTSTSIPIPIPIPIPLTIIGEVRPQTEGLMFRRTKNQTTLNSIADAGWKHKL